MLPAPSWDWVSMEHQQFLALHHDKSKSDAAWIVYIWSLDRFYMLKCSWIQSCRFGNGLSCYCLGGCWRNISCLSAYNGSQLLVYWHLRSSATSITHDSRSDIIHVPSTLSFEMGQGACRYRFAQYRQPILSLCITTTKSLFNYLTYKTQNRWCSVDAHFATGVSTICNHCIWHSIWIMVRWQPLDHCHVLSRLSLHWSLNTHIHISFKIYVKLSANCR